MLTTRFLSTSRWVRHTRRVNTTWGGHKGVRSIPSLPPSAKPYISSARWQKRFYAIKTPEEAKPELPVEAQGFVTNPMETEAHPDHPKWHQEVYQHVWKSAGWFRKGFTLIVLCLAGSLLYAYILEESYTVLEDKDNRAGLDKLDITGEVATYWEARLKDLPTTRRGLCKTIHSLAFKSIGTQGIERVTRTLFYLSQVTQLYYPDYQEAYFVELYLRMRYAPTAETPRVPQLLRTLMTKQSASPAEDYWLWYQLWSIWLPRYKPLLSPRLLMEMEAHMTTLKAGLEESVASAVETSLARHRQFFIDKKLAPVPIEYQLGVSYARNYATSYQTDLQHDARRQQQSDQPDQGAHLDEDAHIPTLRVQPAPSSAKPAFPDVFAQDRTDAHRVPGLDTTPPPPTSSSGLPLPQQHLVELTTGPVLPAFPPRPPQ